MGRFCNGLMTVFRIVQLVLSLAALACGAFITYYMISMSNAAHNIETSLDNLNNAATRQSIEQTLEALDITDDEVKGFLEVLDTLLTPILHVFEGTPTRAIILTVVSLWSLCIITYLLLAQRATKKATDAGLESPRRNKRSIRISLELLTLILWIIGIVCAILLAIEYGGILFTGGADLKLAWSAVKPIIAKALDALVADGKVVQELAIVNDIFDIGALSILAVVAACICGFVSFVSLLAACCISGKAKKRNGSPENGAAEYLMATSAGMPGFTVSGRPSPASWAVRTPMCEAPLGYSPAPQHEGGPSSWYR